jgi:hypothetical protein
MSKLLKSAFLAQAILGILVGLSLLLAPGRFLGLVYWQPIDVILSRLLGAALLAMSWTSIYGFRAANRAQAAVLIQMQAIFCGLGALGILRHLINGAYYAPVIWIIFGILAVFAMIWIWALIPRRKI